MDGLGIGYDKMETGGHSTLNIYASYPSFLPNVHALISFFYRKYTTPPPCAHLIYEGFPRVLRAYYLLILPLLLRRIHLPEGTYAGSVYALFLSQCLSGSAKC